MPGNRLKKILIGSALLLVAGGSARAYLRYAEGWESTDDAYLDGNIHPISARVNGTVVEVLTDDNRVVHKGDPLVRLDARDFEVRLSEARSDELSAEAAVAQTEAQIRQAEGQVSQAEAGIAQTSAQLDKTGIDMRRSVALIAEHAIPAAMHDTYKSNQEVATATAASSRAVRVAALATVRAAEANRHAAQAKLETAKAAVRDAELQLSYATVLAPTDGRVGKKSVEVGQRVQPGQALLAVVGADTWVVANFKESQLTRMRPGQTVRVDVDAIADHPFEGTIESFSPGTGAKFSLLPPDNATGNFTKVVQRLPIKIRFTTESMRGFEERLAPGLSANAKVKLQ